MEQKTKANDNQNQYPKIEYPRKPKRTEEPKKTLKILCNLNKITLGEGTKGKHTMEYEITYDPEISEDNKNLKNTIFKQLKEDLAGMFELYFRVGDSIFICTKKAKEKILLETKIKDREYTVTFKKKSEGKNNCTSLVENAKENKCQKKFFEYAVRNICIANNHFIRLSDNSYYDYYDVVSCGRNKKSKIWNGYSFSVRITEFGPFLCINNKKKTVAGRNAYEKIKEIAEKYGGNFSNPQCKKEINSFFKGKIVIAQYGNYRPYKIGEVDLDKNILNTTFTMESKEGKPITVNIKEYYKLQYQISLKYDDQPLLIEEISEKDQKKDNIKIKYLIPELVYLTGNDELDREDRKKFFGKASNQPEDKYIKISQGKKYLFQEENKKTLRNGKIIESPSPNIIRKDWGINFDDNFTEISTHCLPIPFIKFAKGEEQQPKIFEGKFKIKEAIAPVNFDKNNCILLTFENLVDLAKLDCEQMSKAAQAFGLQFNLPELVKLKTKDKNEIENELRKIDFNNGKKMAIFVLDDTTRNFYPPIKDFLYTQGGVASQCMLHDEKTNPGRNKFCMSYYSTVLNQMVVKANGELFEIKFCDAINKKPTMFVGIDCSKNKQGLKIVMSASYNRRFNKFFTDYKIFNESENKNDQLMDLFAESLNYFKSINKKYPENIIIYRSADNQKEKDMKEEIIDIQKLFNGNASEGAFKENYKPKVTLFFVNKNDELKFFDKTEAGYKNVKLGTIIDEGVVSPDNFEFYLQCQQFDRAFSSPVHFFCGYNNNEEISLDEFERITFNLSYYYWNHSGPIQIPVALRYAEEANRFGTMYLVHDVLPEIKNSPYFI